MYPRMGKDVFVTKDSGERIEYPSGMRRDVQEGKPLYTLIYRPFLTRIAMHLTRGAVKYGRNNWRMASSRDEFERFRDSAIRHLMQWLDGERDEDHASAVVFNLMAGEYVRERLIADGKEAEVKVTESGAMVGGADVAAGNVAFGKGHPHADGAKQPGVRPDAVLPHDKAGSEGAGVQASEKDRRFFAAIAYVYYIAGSGLFIAGLNTAGSICFAAGSVIGLVLAVTR